MAEVPNEFRFLPEAVKEFLRWRILEAHRHESSSPDGDYELASEAQEMLAVQRLLPYLRHVRDDMAKRGELLEDDGVYVVSRLVPRPSPRDPESSVLCYEELELEISEYGHASWRYKSGPWVPGLRYMALRDAQDDLKLVAKAIRDGAEAASLGQILGNLRMT